MAVSKNASESPSLGLGLNLCKADMNNIYGFLLYSSECLIKNVLKKSMLQMLQAEDMNISQAQLSVFCILGLFHCCITNQKLLHAPFSYYTQRKNWGSRNRKLILESGLMSECKLGLILLEFSLTSNMSNLNFRGQGNIMQYSKTCCFLKVICCL